MKSYFSLACAAFLLLSVATNSHAATYECTAVDKKATVSSDQSVSISSDSSSKTCSFSVNGASTGKQPLDPRSVLQGLLQGHSVLSGNDRERALAALLMAASPGAVREIDFGNKVRNQMNDIERCVNEFLRGGYPSISNYGALSCEVIRPGQRSRTIGANVEADEPTLNIAFSDGRQVHQVFIPQSLRRRQ